MRQIRVRDLRKRALAKFPILHREHRNIPFKTFFRWVKEAYIRGDLEGM